MSASTVQIFFSNHWMNIAQIIKLSLVDQSEVYICLEWRKTRMADEHKYLKLNIDQHLVGGSFKLKLSGPIWSAQMLGDKLTTKSIEYELKVSMEKLREDP